MGNQPHGVHSPVAHRPHGVDTPVVHLPHGVDTPAKLPQLQRGDCTPEAAIHTKLYFVYFKYVFKSNSCSHCFHQ